MSVDDTARQMNDVPGAGGEGVPSQGEGHRAVEHIEALVGALMNVRRRPELRLCGQLGEGEGAARIRTGELEREPVSDQPVSLALAAGYTTAADGERLFRHDFLLECWYALDRATVRDNRGGR